MFPNKYNKVLKKVPTIPSNSIQLDLINSVSSTESKQSFQFGSLVDTSKSVFGTKLATSTPFYATE